MGKFLQAGLHKPCFSTASCRSHWPDGPPFIPEVSQSFSHSPVQCLYDGHIWSMDHGLDWAASKSGSVSHKWVWYEFAEGEPPLSSGSCSSFPLLLSFLCVWIFWEHALIPSMCTDVRSALFPVSESQLPLNIHLSSIRKPVRGCTWCVVFKRASPSCQWQ